MAGIIGYWGDVSIEHMFYAYRKAKADCFFEKSICISLAFAEFEKNLYSNIKALLDRIVEGDIEKLLLEHLGEPRFVAKKLSKGKPLGASTEDHSYFSDSTRAFKRLSSTWTLQPEFRLVGDFPVEMHILSALWINLVGHEYDAKLTKAAFGSRLRRYRPEAGSLPGTVGNYHREAIGSFQPYFNPYKDWREKGLRSIRSELEEDRQVIAISMDITSYYHRLDPSFMANPKFLKDAGINLSRWQLQFSAIVSDVLSKWSEKVRAKLHLIGCEDPVETGGLPIGLSLSRVISNAFLIRLDRQISEGVSPVFYGRYVDDIFLVIRDPGNIYNSDDLLKFIGNRVDCFPKNTDDDGNIFLSYPSYKKTSSLLLQKQKQKIFFLEGKAGIDLLDNIDKQIRSVSSERRLMPNPDQLDSMASAKVLSAAGHPSEEADTLRKADGLAVRRLSWSVQLRAVETIARDLAQSDWTKERANFYKFAHDHILRADKILDQLDYLPRLISLAVAMEDWSDARRMYDATKLSLRELATLSSARPKVNGFNIVENSEAIWTEIFEHVKFVCADSIARSFRWTKNGGMRSLSGIALGLCEELGLGTTKDSIEQISTSLRECDWAKTPYRDHVRRDAVRQRPFGVQEERLQGIYRHELDLREFLDQTAVVADGVGAKRVSTRCCHDQSPSLLPYLFPTRPYSAQDVTLFLPDQCVFGARPEKNWARFVRAIRGVWVWPNLVNSNSGLAVQNDEQGPPSNNLLRVAEIGAPKKKVKVLLGITSLLTSDETYKATASGASDISRARYASIQKVVNLAIEARPAPTHLLLPELSLPERWIETVSGFLRDAGISLIAGLDYQHSAVSTSIFSEAILVLSDDRLGFPSSVQIRQNKALPAPAEDEGLQHKFGKYWLSGLEKDEKPIYNHGGFCFGVLVCSELQNVSHRLKFQGGVDCLMVLSWNQDIETFSSLVESSSLDVHAHIALVNNRRFGDSRVRTPAKKSYERDLCRIRGGENDQVVVVELEIQKLRSFQSRAKRWPDFKDPYKPVPEAFAIASYRQTTPS
jgi:hypothetical protein